MEAKNRDLKVEKISVCFDQNVDVLGGFWPAGYKTSTVLRKQGHFVRI